MINFELIAMILSMAGAYQLSKLNRLSSGILFLLSNYFLFIESIRLGLIPLSIQLILFSCISIYMIYNQLKNKKYIIYISLISLTYYIVIFKFSFNSFNDYHLSNFENIALIVAIVATALASGRFLYYGFLLYLISDSMYIVIAIENDLYYFLLQNIFYIVMSVKGLKKLKLSGF